MADPNYSWVYLIIFLAIPLARIIPRILAKKGIGVNTPRTIQGKQFETGYEEYSQKPQMESDKPQMESDKPQTKNNLVLGALNRGSKTFEDIQKNTGLNNSELDAILEDLENNGLMKVVHKQGMLGPKTEILPTDKGFKEYYS
ncbi:MAG: hypothetical protein GKS07_01795 [Nitrosopumilus sp.]|nr:MAG: hypothetical protein GKS07_01795 [Nitrosopumilus sp.]